MPDPNEPLPDGGQVFTGQLAGLLEPITLPTLTGANYGAAQRAVSDATRLLLGAAGDNIDFHLIFRDGPTGPVLRSMWRVQAVAGGPALRPFTEGSYATTVNFSLRIWPYTERLQVIYGENESTDWTYRGQMSPIVPALLLRQLWATVPGTVDGDGARVLTVGSLGTARFTPSLVRFARMNNDQATEVVPWNFADDPQNNRVASYPYTFTQNQDRVPGLWLVTAGAEPYQRKVSYLVDNMNSDWTARWDDADEPAPAFTPLVWPEEVTEQEGPSALQQPMFTDADVEDADVELE